MRNGERDDANQAKTRAQNEAAVGSISPANLVVLKGRGDKATVGDGIRSATPRLQILLHTHMPCKPQSRALKSTSAHKARTRRPKHNECRTRLLSPVHMTPSTKYLIALQAICE